MILGPKIREALPLELRRALRRSQRFAADFIRGADLSPPHVQDVTSWFAICTVEQAMGTTPYANAKRHNIALAGPSFSSRPIRPDGLFSFWGWLGAPSRARGFQQGRALRNDRVALETGGGLCQLAGALYFAGLQAGLTVTERHAHSTDLYTDETRYAPLGSDATVSFGFKDLRLRNPHNCAVAFEVSQSSTHLSVRVVAVRPLAATTVEFRQTPNTGGCVSVETWAGGVKIAQTRYLKLAVNSASAASPV